MPRVFADLPLQSGENLTLTGSVARHLQVLRMQPGRTLTIFNGQGGEFEASILRISRSEVDVTIGAFSNIERENRIALHLFTGVPANERMDYLIEKAAELGAASVTPLQTQRSVLRLSGERALKKQSHWQAIAEASSEQCGRNRVMQVRAFCTLEAALESLSEGFGKPYLLSLSPNASTLSSEYEACNAHAKNQAASFFSGPEGGFSPEEEKLLLAHPLKPVSLGARILRAETAPLAALAIASLLSAQTL